jgi:hypothetical protein
MWSVIDQNTIIWHMAASGFRCVWGSEGVEETVSGQKEENA